ncbi:MAG TPA: hypothetical protein ENI27_09450 [bacterium]|nr:hypothetical protein [bacterium]
MDRRRGAAADRLPDAAQCREVGFEADSAAFAGGAQRGAEPGGLLFPVFRGALFPLCRAVRIEVRDFFDLLSGADG